MQRTLLVAALVSLTSLTSPTSSLSAQDVRQQGNVLFWPIYTDQARWNRTTAHAVNFAVGAIHYAKAKGQTVEDVGRHFGDLFAPTWGPANMGVPIRAARAMFVNFGAFPNAEASLVAATDTSASVRFRRSWVSQFGARGENMGVSVAEYERLVNAISDRIAAHLGLRYAGRVDGDWFTMTFSGKAGSALAAFPRSGVFTATLTAEQAGAPANAGTFTLSFTPDGHFVLAGADSEAKVKGRYSIWLDQMTVGEEAGPWACTGFAPGTYRFTPQPNGAIVFGRLTDACDGRARFFGRSWAKK